VAKRISIGIEKAGRARRNLLGPMFGSLRVSRGMTQAALCAKLQMKGWDISRQVLQFIEEGARMLSDIEVFALLQAMDASPGDLEGEFRKFRKSQRSPARKPKA